MSGEKNRLSIDINLKEQLFKNVVIKKNYFRFFFNNTTNLNVTLILAT